MNGHRFDRITIDPNRMHGLPCIRDTDVTVSTVVGRLSAGSTVDQVLADYPYLDIEDILAALNYTVVALARAPFGPPE